MPLTQTGRPRRYDLDPAGGFKNQNVAMFVAALDELTARLVDLIAGLDPQLLDLVPEDTANSMAMLAVHMAWAEATWVSRITGAPIPDDLLPDLLPGKQGSNGELPCYKVGNADLVALCWRVRREFSKPALATLDGIDDEIPDANRPMTARGVLMHLIWHWTYHSGQVGLLRRQAGARYQWTFDRTVGQAP